MPMPAPCPVALSTQQHARPKQRGLVQPFSSSFLSTMLSPRASASPSPFSHLCRSPQLLFVNPSRARSPSKVVFSQLKPLDPNCSPCNVHSWHEGTVTLAFTVLKTPKFPMFASFRKTFPFPSLIPITLKKLPIKTLLQGDFCNFSLLSMDFGKDLKSRETRWMVLSVGLIQGSGLHSCPDTILACDLRKSLHPSPM